MAKEFEIINYFRSKIGHPGSHVIKGPGDDMAVMSVGNTELLVTADTLLEGVHFDLSTATLVQVGYKAMACSLSDCAAMCSVPIGAVGCTSLPNHFSMTDIEQLHAGVQNASQRFNCPIIGGDVTSWDKPLAISITMFSIMENGRKPVYRNGAKVGDKILVTGKLGGSIHGRHLAFTPRINEALWLYDNCQLHSLMDVSDGIAGDLRHICNESTVSAMLYYDKIPISEEIRAAKKPTYNALSDGEDFELLFTVGNHECDLLLAKWNEFSDLPLTIIGEVIEQTNGPEIYLKIDDNVTLFNNSGWEHLTK